MVLCIDLKRLAILALESFPRARVIIVLRSLTDSVANRLAISVLQRTEQQDGAICQPLQLCDIVMEPRFVGPKWGGKQN